MAIKFAPRIITVRPHPQKQLKEKKKLQSISGS